MPYTGQSLVVKPLLQRLPAQPPPSASPVPVPKGIPDRVFGLVGHGHDHHTHRRQRQTGAVSRASGKDGGRYPGEKSKNAQGRRISRRLPFSRRERVQRSSSTPYIATAKSFPPGGRRRRLGTTSSRLASTAVFWLVRGSANQRTRTGAPLSVFSCTCGSISPENLGLRDIVPPKRILWGFDSSFFGDFPWDGRFLS